MKRLRIKYNRRTGKFQFREWFTIYQDVEGIMIENAKVISHKVIAGGRMIIEVKDYKIIKGVLTDV